MDRFQWITKNVAMPEVDIALLEQWISAVALDHGKQAHELTYIFCDDEEILRVNRHLRLYPWKDAPRRYVHLT